MIERLKINHDNMDSNYLAMLNNQEHEIKNTISEITQSIDNLKKLLNSNDVRLLSTYKSRNADFRRLPTKFIASIIPTMAIKEQIHELLGSMIDFSIIKVEDDYTMNVQGAETSDKPLVDDPHSIQEINTEYGLRRVSCLSDEEIWTCGLENIMNLYNIRGELVKSIQTISGNLPRDIAVTRSGELVYTDYKDRSVNLVNDTQIHEAIRLQGWRPHSVCGTSSGDLMVAMTSDDDKQTKIERYSEYVEKQSIQHNDEGQPLYSSGEYNIKYITENRNLDICVSDWYNWYNCAVVVVNQAGVLRFNYTGPSASNGLFRPYGITTDSQSRIITQIRFSLASQGQT